MGKLYHLNKIKIKDEADALEFIDMVAIKLPDVKKVLKKSQMEKQSLRNKVAMPAPRPTHAPNSSVLDRVTEAPLPLGEQDSEEQSRIAQLRAASAEPVVPQPGEIGNLNLNLLGDNSQLGGSNESEGTDEDEVQQENTGNEDSQNEESQDQETVVPPSTADLTPIGDRVAGKAQSFENAERRSNRARFNLRKK